MASSQLAGDAEWLVLALYAVLFVASPWRLRPVSDNRRGGRSPWACLVRVGTPRLGLSSYDWW
jgi:hypothetical protein